MTLVQVFSRTNLITDSEHFYNSVLELLNDQEEKEEVEQLLLWWNRQIFLLYIKIEWLPSKNSALARICAKRVELCAAVAVVGAVAAADHA